MYCTINIMNSCVSINVHMLRTCIFLQAMYVSFNVHNTYAVQYFNISLPHSNGEWNINIMLLQICTHYTTCAIKYRILYGV